MVSRDREIAAVESCREDFELHAETCLYINDHNDNTIKLFKPRAGQKILNAVIKKQLDDTGMVRIIVPKARRVGVSTNVQALYYSKASLHENIYVFIVAHEQDSTNTLFDMAKLMHERNEMAPPHKHCNERALVFDNEDGTGLKSKYRVTTAKNVAGGRSQGINLLHISEEALWGKDAPRLLDGLCACVPKPPAPAMSYIIRESTCRGFGNTFADDALRRK
jgi:hypothetical protein